MKQINCTISIVLMDRFSKRNIETSNLISLLKKRHFTVKLLDESIYKKGIFFKLIRIIKNHYYTFLRIRFGEIRKFKKHAAKRAHQKDNILDFYDKIRLIYLVPFPKSKKIFNILHKIYLLLPVGIKPGIIVGTVILTNVQLPFAQSVIKYCEHNHIKMIGLLNSWDHLTHYAQVIKSPYIKKYLVWNEIQKKEMIKFHKINAKKISIVGAMQFDIFHQEKIKVGEIYERFKIDPEKKILFLPAYNKRLGHFEPKAIKYIIDHKQDIIEDFIIIIRSFPVDNNFHDRFSEVLQNEKVINAPLSKDIIEDRRTMSLLLRQSSIVLSGSGTAALEAMYYDTPVIHLGIDEREKVHGTTLHYKFFFSDHYRTIMKRNPSFFIIDYKELPEAINSYFRNPKLYQDRRYAVIKEQIHYLDGKSAVRISEKIDSIID